MKNYPNAILNLFEVAQINIKLNFHNKVVLFIVWTDRPIIKTIHLFPCSVPPMTKEYLLRATNYDDEGREEGSYNLELMFLKSAI